MLTGKALSLMKISPKRAIAVYISLSAALVSGLVVLIFIEGNQDYHLVYPIASILLVFILSYSISRYFLNKTLDNFSIHEKSSSKDLDNVVPRVNHEVLTFSNNQTKEIDRLMEMEQYRKEYLGNVSHELKTPIFNIQGYVLTLLDGGLEDAEINRKYLERAEKSINRLISIVDDLETITRHEAGELKLQREYFNIVLLVEEVFEAQEIRAKERNTQLTFDKKYKKPIIVCADKMKIFQVLTNLIANSIYYGKMGGKTSVSFTEANKSILVEVHDNGIGIAPADLTRVFERFYRVDKSRSREQGGTGLGLAIVKHIIEAHKETIRVKSKLNKGSSFIFSLPKMCSNSEND
jgi:two-component system phosphate regulon sensor histidine kinase PhoR